MARNTIEKAPFEFSHSLYKIEENYNYLLKYKEVDNKGRYFFWDEFKYRVPKEDDAKIAWWATKWARFTKMKSIEYKDKDKKVFSFCMPDALQAKLHRISKLSAQGIVPHNSIKRNYLISSLLMEEAISSSQLEGASTTRRVAKKMLSSGRKPRNEDELMIVNNYLLMQEVKRTKNEDLTIDMILKYHKIATRENQNNGNIAGTFRSNNEIVITDGFEVVHEPPCFKNIPKRLNIVCEFANKEHLGENGEIFIHPIVKAIILHFMIGYEHPFPDGNGRTARAIFYWYMLKNGFDYFEYVSISKLLKDAPTQYGKSFLYSENDDNDLTYFIFYQVDIIIRAIDELLNYLQDKSKEFEEVTQLLSTSKIGNSLNFIQKDIVKKAIKNPGRIFTSKEIMLDYDKTANTARKYLNELVDYEILATIKNGNTKGYIAPANIRDVLENNK
ncbi:MloA [hydrothermal vent metagenome]|uniref:MloA n=1 Tax=hydrothermal vent metagenome TaxID=652676 RepID=A0A1W1CQD8_9ZZZZ